MSNVSDNNAAYKEYREQLKSMFRDIDVIDFIVLNRAVNIGLANAKRNTPVDTGYMRRSWSSTRTEKITGGIAKAIINTADYASFVNDGHRTVNRAGETTGWVNGYFILEKAIHSVNLALVREFKKEVEKVAKEHND